MTRSLALFLFTGLLSYFVHSNEQPIIKGALCLLNVDNQILLVEEIITGKLSLPGGTIERDEEPKLAAQRETWEETGLVVSVERKLGQTESAYIYHCVSESNVPVFEYQDDKFRRTIPSWYSPHYGVETKRVFLTELLKVDRQDYRYPQQWPYIKSLFVDANSQSAHYLRDMLDSASRVQMFEISLINTVQATVKLLPDAYVVKVNQVARLFESIASREALTLSFAIVFFFFGLRFTLKMCLLSVSLVVVSYIIHIGVALPKPFEYLPHIRLGNSYGYSMPNIPAVVITAFSSVALRQFKLVYGHTFYPRLFFSTLLLCYAISGVYLGSQYMSGIVVGILLGRILAWNFTRLDRNIQIKNEAFLFHPIVWLVMAAIGALISYLAYAGFINQLTVSCISIALFVVIAKEEIKPKVTPSILLGILTISLSHHILFNWLNDFVSSSGKHSVIVNLLFIPSLLFIFLLVFSIGKNKNKLN